LNPLNPSPKLDPPPRPERGGDFNVTSGSHRKKNTFEGWLYLAVLTDFYATL
jgi:hypothetical protein